MTNYVRFSIPKITTKLNDKGEEKKKLEDVPSKWEQLTKDTYKKYLNSTHKAVCLLTGKINNLTVIDFDSVDSYNKMLESYPELQKYKTIKTKNGFHIYCNYNPNVLQTTNALVDFDSVDIRNDKGMVFCPPTTYTTLNGDLITYTDLGGEIMDIPEIIINNLKQNQVKETKKKPNKLIVVEEQDTDTESNDDTLTKERDLLNQIFIPNKKDRTTWIAICSAIKSISSLNSQDWIALATREKLNMDKEKNELFEKIKPMDYGYYYLQKYCKKSNPQGFKEWLIRWNEYLTIELLSKGEVAIALFISKPLIQSLKYFDKEWYNFSNETGLWTKIDEPSATIASVIHRKIDEALSCLEIRIENADGELYKKLVESRTTYNSYYNKCGKGSYISQIIKYLKTHLCDDRFGEKINNGFYKMVFQNGIMDLRTLVFQKGINQTDYMTTTILFDYEEPTKDQIQYVKDNLKKICNYNDSHLEYYLSTIGYALTSDSEKEQNFWYLRGQTASNGKSVIFECLETLMPNYVLKAMSDCLDKGTDLRKKVNTWKDIKILWLNEVSTKKKDEDVVKAICDGTGYKYNKLYSKDAIIMKIMFKLFCVSNNSLIIKSDAGFIRRFKLEQFNSQFSPDNIEDNFETLQFKVNKDFKTELTGEYKNAFLKLLMSYSKQYADEKCLKPYPPEWNEEAKDNISSNNEFQNWIEETFEFGTTEEYLVSKTLVDEYLPTQYKNYNIKDELVRMKKIFRYDSQKRLNGKKGFYIGLKMKVQSECLLDA